MGFFTKIINFVNAKRKFASGWGCPYIRVCNTYKIKNILNT